MDYNEQEAIKYIRSKMTADALTGVDDDEILNVIDIIWDYYEDKGLLDIDLSDDDDDDVIDLDELVAYVTKMVTKDKKCPLRLENVRALVEAEIEFEDMLDADM